MALRVDDRQQTFERHSEKTLRLATPARVLVAFAVVYLVWGSTYLAIRFAVESIPPLLMSGTRFLAAGGALYAWCAWRSRGEAHTIAGVPCTTRAHWKAATTTALFLITAAYGLVSWAELTVPSGIVAVATATTPLWMVVIPWIALRTPRPPALVLGGVALGLGAQVLLFGVGSTAERNQIDPLGLGAVLLAGVAWALGSLRARQADLPDDPFLSSAMQMLTGGALLVVLGLVVGEGARFSLASVTTRSWLALLYLVVAGSMVAYSAYLYLLKTTSPARASTYAYVNPIVAVMLGWLLAAEPVGWHAVVAMGLTLVAVLAINHGATEE
jgi:drug/metabolite transporter (DMT)-like permease